MDEEGVAGSGASRVDWDDLTPAVERVAGDTDDVPESEPPVSGDEPTDSDADDTDDTDDTTSLAEAVIQADKATWTPQRPDDDNFPEDEDSEEGPDPSDGDPWADLTPAVERVAPVPAVERVAPVPAVTRIDDEDDEHPWDSDGDRLSQADDEEFTNPAADFAASDTVGGDTTTQSVQKGPPDDAEAPLAEHIEEMVKRLGIVIAVAGAVSLALFPMTGDVINFLWHSILPGTEVASPHVYHPLEYKLTQLKTASLAGLIIALPVFVYQTYRFMRPGLYPHERRYYLASVPTSLILGLLGVLFAYFIVLPAVMSYFLYYSEEVVTIAFALGATFDLILLLMGYLAVVFQIPLFVMLAIMMGLTTREWLEGRRLLFWGAFLGISFLFSPDPTGMAPVLVAATMVVLFEGTLLLLRWTGR